MSSEAIMGIMLLIVMSIGAAGTIATAFISKGIQLLLECILAHCEANTKHITHANFITADNLTFEPKEDDIDIPFQKVSE